MIWLKAVVLGVVQGLTEFLPVSSSGHLVLVRHFVGLDEAGVGFDILLHLGTMFAILTVYHRDARETLDATWRLVRGSASPDQRRTVVCLAIGLAPAIVVGFLGRDEIATAFASPRFASAMLLVTAMLLFASGRGRGAAGDLSPARALVIGLLQMAAILPGISRSGSTISGGMLAGVRPDRAARFSFLMAVPLFLGAAVLGLPDYFSGAEAVPPGPALVGFLTSFVAGYLAIRWLLRTLRSGRFVYFGLYCLVVGVVGLISSS